MTSRITRIICVVFLLLMMIGNLDYSSASTNIIMIDPIEIKYAQHITEFRRYQERAGAHNGYDIYCDVGTEIRAAADGKVIEVNRSKGLGIYVAIDHGKDENGKEIVTVYGHMSLKTVEPGMIVKQGDKIGEVGKTGGIKNSHCHFEVRKDGKNTNPQQYAYQYVKVTTPNAWWGRRQVCKDSEHVYESVTTDRYHYQRCTKCGKTTELIENDEH